MLITAKKHDRSGKILQEIIHRYCSKKESVVQIAAALGVSRQAVYERLATAGIKTNPRNFAPRPLKQFDRETLVQLYVKKALPFGTILTMLRSSNTVVWRELNRHGIPRRPRYWRPLKSSELDRLRKVGDSCIMPCRRSRVAYVCIYAKAACRDMKVSIRRIRNTDNVRVRRIA
jgi:hypothetical protein